MKEKLLKLYRFSNSWTGTIIIVLMIIFFVAQAFVIPSGSMISTMLIGDHLFVKKFAYGVPTPHIPFAEIPLMKNDNGHLIDGDRPQRDDIVIFRYPMNHKFHFVKRCVAVGGDELFLHNKDLFLKPHEGDEFTRKRFAGYELVTIDGALWVKNPYTKLHPGIHYEEPKIDEFSGFGSIKEELESPTLYYMLHKNGTVNFETQGSLLEAMDVAKRKYYFGPFKVPSDEYFMMGDNRDNSADSRFWGTVKYAEVVGKPWFIYFSWDDDYKIRWDRVGKTVHDLESYTGQQKH